MSARFPAARIASLATVLALAIGAATAGPPRAHTYSIVARDPVTGEMGVAVQSHWFPSDRWCRGPRRASGRSPPSRSSR